MKKILSFLLLIFAVSVVSCKKSQSQSTSEANQGTSSSSSSQNDDGLNVEVTEDTMKLYLKTIKDIVKEFKRVGFNFNTSGRAENAVAGAELNSFIKDKGWKDMHHFTASHAKIAMGWGWNKLQKAMKNMPPSARAAMGQSADQTYKSISPKEKALFEKYDEEIGKVFQSIVQLNN
jgi:hypothetical protein